MEAFVFTLAVWLPALVLWFWFLREELTDGDYQPRALRKTNRVRDC